MAYDDFLPLLDGHGHAVMDVFPAGGGDPRLSGVFVQRDGALMICAGGSGLGVKLDANAAGGLSLVLAALARHLEAEAARAAADAVADADAVLRRATTGAMQ